MGSTKGQFCDHYSTLSIYIIYTFKKVLFVDDTNLLLSHHDPIAIANEEIEKVNLWLKCNKLSLNIKKNNYIIFRSNKKYTTDREHVP